MKKYYDILGLKENCDQELIKAAYKTLIHKYHPDKWEKNKALAREKFIAIKNAYIILSKQKNNSNKKQDDIAKNTNFQSISSKKINYLKVLFFLIITFLILFYYIKEHFFYSNKQENKSLFLSNQLSLNTQKFCLKLICIDNIKIKSEIQKNEKESIKFLYGYLDEKRKILYTFFIKKRECFKCKDELLIVHNNFDEKNSRWSSSIQKNNVLIQSAHGLFTNVSTFNNKQFNLYSIDFFNKNRSEKSIFSYIFIQNHENNNITYIGKYLRGRIFGNSCEKLGFYSSFETEIIDKKLFINRIENYFFGCENNKISNSSVTKFLIEKKIY